MIRSALLSLALAIAPVDFASAQAVRVETLDGVETTGQLVDWQPGSITLETNQGEYVATAAELLGVRIGQAQAGDAAASANFTSPCVVRLHNGSVLPATQVTVAERRATIRTSFSTDELVLPTSAIELIDLAPGNVAAREAWQAAQQRELPGDLLFVLKKDGAAVDYLAGVVGAVTDEVVDFEWEGDRIPVKLSKVAGIAFYRSQNSDSARAACRVQMADGTQLAAAGMLVADGLATIVLASGGEIKLPLEKIVSVDYSLGKIAYLGDLRPLQSRWTPLVGMPAAAESIAAYGEPRFNRSFSGAPIELLVADEGQPSTRRRQSFARGLALRSRTEIVYAVPRDMTRFAALAGIAPDCAAEGKVALTVSGDRDILWEGVVLGGEPPQEISVDLAGARRVRIVVDYGGNRDYGDELHLAQARFVK